MILDVLITLGSLYKNSKRVWKLHGKHLKNKEKVLRKAILLENLKVGSSGGQGAPN